MRAIFNFLINPLRSRKMRIAIAVIASAYGAEAGLGASETMIYTLISAGVGLILGIAIEDAGEKSRR